MVFELIGTYVLDDINKRLDGLKKYAVGDQRDEVLYDLDLIKLGRTPCNVQPMGD